MIALATEKQNYLQKVGLMRRAINKQLDNMEKTVTNEIHTLHQKEHEQLSNQLKDIKSNITLFVSCKKR